MSTTQLTQPWRGSIQEARLPVPLRRVLWRVDGVDDVAAENSVPVF